MKAEKGIIFRF